MKTIIILLITILNVYGCHSQGEEMELPVSGKVPEITDSMQVSTSNTLQITINKIIFFATLADNATSKAFKNMLPITMPMNDLNRNEKYYYLQNNLPTAAFNPTTIQNGDIMLYGASTLVLFYKTFSTSYSYTKIGKIDNPSKLQSVVGSGSISITFELINK